MRYDLTRLGPFEFENLSQALAVAVLGNGVTVFGDGPDGGREATFDGNLSYPSPSPATGCWSGYGVVQAKFKRTVTSTKSDTDWLIKELSKELDAWADDTSGRVARGRKPNYLVVTTNVTLSPDPQRGGIDRAAALLKIKGNKIGLSGCAIWHHDQICRYLDIHDGVRRTYGGLTMTGDVLAEVQAALARLARDEIPDQDFSTLLTNHAAKELLAQQWVRLSEAGHPTNQRLMLSDVAIDLPARPLDSDSPDRIAGTVSHVVGLGDTIRRERPASRSLPHLAIVGGPGQGKTTLGQLICQTYRVAILEDRPPQTLGPEIPELLGQYRRHLDLLGIRTPHCRRWPVRVLLSEFADVIAEKPSTTLLGYIASRTRESSPINVRMLKEWLRAWPWLLVLDGLDEVADPEIRQKTLSALSDFYIDAASLGADLFVVATTRPQGYQKELSTVFFAHIALDPMEISNALEYAEHLVAVRFPNDPEMHDRVLERLKAAAQQPITSRLMRTPLQVAIMSILLERRPRAPRDRHGLFEAYYNTLYDREVAKNTPIARLLDEQRPNVDRIHERVGQLLQVRAERAGEAEANLPHSELEKIALDRLLQEEHPQVEAQRLASELAKAATDRLVMLVGHTNATVGFEVRSLQELMAARSFFTGTDLELSSWLRKLAVSAHWRNTWLFAITRIFTQREALRNDIIVLLEELDADSPLATRLLPGARLAVDMLDEDVVSGQPRYRRLLLAHALRLLDTSYPGESMTALARVVHDAVTQEATLTHTVLTAVDAKLKETGRGQVTALDFVAAWSEHTGDASVAARSRIEKLARSTPSALEPAVDSLRLFGGRRAWIPYQSAGAPPREPEATRISRLLTRPGYTQGTVSVLIRKLGDITEPIPELDAPEVQETFLAAVGDLESTNWMDAAAVERRLLHWRSRQPVPDDDLAEFTHASI